MRALLFVWFLPFPLLILHQIYRRTAAIGAAPETFSRLLMHLKTNGKLVWEGKTISIDACVWEARKKSL
jgi:hypothetical protein